MRDAEEWQYNLDSFARTDLSKGPRIIFQIMSRNTEGENVTDNTWLQLFPLLTFGQFERYQPKSLRKQNLYERLTEVLHFS